MEMEEIMNDPLSNNMIKSTNKSSYPSLNGYDHVGEKSLSKNASYLKSS